MSSCPGPAPRTRDLAIFVPCLRRKRRGRGMREGRRRRRRRRHLSASLSPNQPCPFPLGNPHLLAIPHDANHHRSFPTTPQTTKTNSRRGRRRRLRARAPGRGRRAALAGVDRRAGLGRRQLAQVAHARVDVSFVVGRLPHERRSKKSCARSPRSPILARPAHPANPRRHPKNKTKTKPKTGRATRSRAPRSRASRPSAAPSSWPRPARAPPLPRPPSRKRPSRFVK